MRDNKSKITLIMLYFSNKVNDPSIYNISKGAEKQCLFSLVKVKLNPYFNVGTLVGGALHQTKHKKIYLFTQEISNC